jgi:hypothetical protein
MFRPFTASAGMLIAEIMRFKKVIRRPLKFFEMAGLW